jgi:putative transposase
MLRRRLPKRITVTPAERRRLVRLGRRVGPTVKELISIVTPRSFQRWLRRPGPPRKRATKPGRPRTPEQIREVILRIAGETGWGYTRILGELRKLGVRSVSRTTVRSILLEHGHDPDPGGASSSWRKFLAMHAETLWACDFVSKRIWTKRGLRFAYLLFFIHVDTRRVIVSPASCHPTAAWVDEQAKAFCAQARAMGLPARMLLRDNDRKFSGGVDAVLEAEGVRVTKLVPLSPNLNARAERWAQSVQRECLDHFVILGERHRSHVLTEYAAHFNEERPHQSKSNLPLGVDRPPEAPPLKDAKQVICRVRLGGLLRHYHRAA